MSRINADTKRLYRRHRHTLGANRKEAAAVAGVSYKWAQLDDKKWAEQNEHRKRLLTGEVVPDEPLLDSHLTPDAQRALKDFEYFRARFLGLISKPWQVEAGELVRDRLETDQKEYIVINCPPGSGKSTLFTHDLPAWLTCRDRAIRGLLGHRSEQMARAYTGNLRDTLERQVVLTGDPDDDTIDALATMAGDYGPFRPERMGGEWSRTKFTVLQADAQATVNKEANWVAFGQDSSSIGHRADFVMWDDLVDIDSARTHNSLDRQRQWWDSVAEKRIEPGGVVVLMGQRLGSNDLYRYALDKLGAGGTVDELDAGQEADRKYLHVVYPAHVEDRCQDNHDPETAVPYQGHRSKPHPDGDCLLDPHRLPYRELMADKRNDPQLYATVMQQKDTDPSRVLVPRIAVDGGEDPETGVMYPGCWDPDRVLGQIPDGLAQPIVSLASVDPSVKQWWSIQWWIIQPETQRRYLIDHHRAKMQAPDLLEWHHATGEFSGIMDTWQTRSNAAGATIMGWVIERNAAHQYLLQYEHVKRWMESKRVRIIGHDTYKNKTDPEIGITGLLGPIWRNGQVRLPGDPMSGSRRAAEYLVREVTTFPDTDTTDCVMAQWFAEYNWKNLHRPPSAGNSRRRRPSWMTRAA